MKRLAAVLALALGCGDVLGEPARPELVAAAVDGWYAAELPSVEDCGYEDTTVLATHSQEEFQSHCPQNSEGACLIQATRKDGLEDVAYPVVVMSPHVTDYDSTGGPVVHELLHWCLSCVGRDPDPHHKNPKVFSEAGGATSAQGRAKAFLKELFGY